MRRILQLLSIDNNPAPDRWRRLDARVKLIVAIAAILASLFSTRAALPLATLAVSLCLLAAFGAPWRTVLLRLTAPLGLVLVVAVFARSSPARRRFARCGWAPGRSPYSREGAAEGALLMVRVLGSVGVLVVISHLHASPRNLRRVALDAVSPHGSNRHAHGSLDLHAFRASRQRAVVQRARLGHATFRRTVDSAGRLAGIVLLRSIEQAERTHEAHGRSRIPGLPAGASLRPLTKQTPRHAPCRRAHRDRAGGGKALPVTDSARELPAIEAERHPLRLSRRRARPRGHFLSRREGEFVAVMGANGSGKTTLMKVLMRLASAAAGEVRLAARRRELPPGGVVSPRWAWSFRIRPTSSSPRRSSRTWPSGRGTWGSRGRSGRRASSRRWRPWTRRAAPSGPIHHLSYGQQKRVVLGRRAGHAAGDAGPGRTDRRPGPGRRSRK